MSLWAREETLQDVNSRHSYFTFENSMKHYGAVVGWGYVHTAMTTASRKLLGSMKRTAAAGGVALWRPSRTPPKRGRLFQSAEWGGAGADYSPIPL